MWIASTLGFFSIVQHYDEKRGRGVFYVRARAEQDLKNLKTRAHIGVPIQKWPKADYAYRLIVGGDELTRIMTTLTSTIRYPNFKDQIAKLPDQAPKLHAYHQLWGNLLGLQNNWRPGRRSATEILDDFYDRKARQSRKWDVRRRPEPETPEPRRSARPEGPSRPQPTVSMADAIGLLMVSYGDRAWSRKPEDERAYEVALKMGLSDEDAAQAYYAAGDVAARVKQAWDRVYARNDFASEGYLQPSKEN